MQGLTAVDELRWTDRPELKRPLLVVAFEGLFDAGQAATRAVKRLGEIYDATRLATIDPETFFDFTQQRPLVEIDDEGRRQILWPDNECRAAVVPNGDHDLILLAGIEPHLRWRTFAEALADIVTSTGVELVVTLGANYGMVPHSRPFEVVGSSTNADLAERLGLGRPTYQGPTGAVGVLHDVLDTLGVPVISLRVSAPHYVQGTPNPKAAQALLRRLELVTGIAADPAALDADVREWEQRVEAAVAEDPEVHEYVERLEAQVDRDADPLSRPGDLAAEVEAFLREQGGRDT